MLSEQEYEVAVEELDRLWAADSAGQFKARMEALLEAIEDYEHASTLPGTGLAGGHGR